MNNNVRNEGELTLNMGKRQNQRNILDFLSSPSMPQAMKLCFRRGENQDNLPLARTRFSAVRSGNRN